MYLTNFVHDFHFELNTVMDEHIHTLSFHKTNAIMLFPLVKSKIKFHTNQGRQNYLYWHHNVNSSCLNYQFKVKNIITFFWKKGAEKISYKIYPLATDALIKYWLLHTFLPLYFLIEKKYEILHVGAVEVMDKACLFAAPSFGGKSTLTHYFIQKGHNLLSDDKLACNVENGQYYAVPSYPYARNYRALEDLGEYIEGFSRHRLKIGAIYSLKLLTEDSTISIRELKGMKKFSVIEMCHDMKLSILKQEKFSILNQMAQRIPTYEIGVPQNFDMLDDVYSAIRTHFRSLKNEEEVGVDDL